MPLYQNVTYYQHSDDSKSDLVLKSKTIKIDQNYKENKNVTSYKVSDYYESDLSFNNKANKN